MEKELRSAIEETEKLVKYLQEVLQRAKEGNKHNPELYLCLDLQNKTLKQILSIQTLLSLAQSYLDLKGFPEKMYYNSNSGNCSQCGQFFNSFEKGFNGALHLCKLASLKECGILQADEVTLEFFRKYLEMPDGNLETMCQEIIRLKSKDKVEVMSEDKLREIIRYHIEAYGGKINPKDDFQGFIFDLQNALSSKISKPKKIGREEIANIVEQICNEAVVYNGKPDKEAFITEILKLLDEEE